MYKKLFKYTVLGFVLTSCVILSKSAIAMRRYTYQEYLQNRVDNDRAPPRSKRNFEDASWFVCKKFPKRHPDQQIFSTEFPNCPECDREQASAKYQEEYQRQQAQMQYQREKEERLRQEQKQKEAQEKYQREQEESNRKQQQYKREIEKQRTQELLAAQEQQNRDQIEQEEKKKDTEKSKRENELEKRLMALEKENEELRKKMISLSVHNPSSSVLRTQTIPEDQVVGHCVSTLLKKDPQIFFPWVLTKKISKLMEAEVSSDKSSLPTNILVEGGKSLVSYVKEELEKGLDAEIIREGKNSFKKMVTNIAVIQGNFWTGSDGKVISTVPALLQRLDERNMGQEWVTGWSDLGVEYKKYIAATVLYRLTNDALPKEYKDIEPYLR